jgi:hypothetical protein
MGKKLLNRRVDRLRGGLQGIQKELVRFVRFVQCGKTRALYKLCFGVDLKEDAE